MSTSHCRRTQPVFCTGLQTATVAGGSHTLASTGASAASMAPAACGGVASGRVTGVVASRLSDASTAPSVSPCTARSSAASGNSRYAEGSPVGPPKRHAAKRASAGTRRSGRITMRQHGTRRPSRKPAQNDPAGVDLSRRPVSLVERVAPRHEIRELGAQRRARPDRTGRRPSFTNRSATGAIPWIGLLRAMSA